MKNPPAESAAPRLVSLDALRGFDMIWITAAEGLNTALSHLGSGADGFATNQFRHAPWAGFRAWDLIFPLFVFMAGTSITYSIPRLVESQGRAGAIRRIGRRTLLLFALGILSNGGLSAGLDHVRWAGVLQRISLCYFAASLLFIYLRPRAIVGVCIAALAGYWALLTFVPVPDFGAGDFAEGHNLANWVDRLWLPGRKYAGDHDPEGFLSTLPAIVTCLLGVLAGVLLRDPGRPEKSKAALLAATGFALLLAGCAWGLEFPVIKKIWTSSFVLVAGGWSLVLLAGFYLVIDVWKVRAWTAPLVWVGANALTAYLLCNVFDFHSLAKRFVGPDFTGWLDAQWAGLGGLVVVAVSFALTLALCRFLYQRKIFLRL